MTEDIGFYFVSRSGETEGPYSIDSIEDKIMIGYLRESDFYFDQRQGQWLKLGHHRDLIDIFQRTRSANEVTQITSKEEQNIWYVLKGEMKYGPVPFGELVDMLVDKKVHEFDFVWHPGFDAWKRVAECAQFSAEALQIFSQENKVDLGSYVYRRKSQRAEYSASLFVHNTKKLWRAESLIIGSHGAQLKMISPVAIKAGDVILVHFKPGPEIPAFNAQAEVVNSVIGADMGKQGFAYDCGLKFLKIHHVVQKALNRYISAAA